MTKNEKQMRNEPEQYGRGQHPNSKKNLQMFKEGDVPNPNGRPVGALDVKNRLAKMLENIAPDKIQNAKSITDFCEGISKITNLDAVNARLLYCAIVEGESWAVKEIFDRIAGKPTQAIDLDVSVQDWRAIAADAGLTEEEFLYETKLFVDKQLANGFDSE
jgi:alkylhydroperoxidase/carboxymuconolactone decarboxylase family protein YurZ